MKRGFSLIELIIAIAIASGLALLLFNALNQSTQSLKMVESLAVSDINIVSFYDRFERDITGAFIPVIGDPDLAERTFMQRLEKQKESERAGQEAQAKGVKVEHKAEKSTSLKPVSLRDIQIKKVFVYEEAEQKLKTLSFITDNPFAVYRTAKPRMARVTYTLKRDPLDKNNYELRRRESVKLAFEPEKEAREYVIIRHIKSLRLELLAPPQKDGNKKDEEQESKQQQEKLVVYKTWPAQKEEKKEDEKIADLPRAVKMYVDYDDPIDQLVKKYEFMFAIVCYKSPSPEILKISLIHEQREDQKKKQAEKQRAADQKQPAQAPQPGKTPAAPPTQLNPLFSIGQLTVAKQEPKTVP